ncbi:MAG: carbohydrate ABC transporter permease [Clostridiales bacterium]|nr:carbohydrate ABC transporter permease [Clostridiales bacterium]
MSAKKKIDQILLTVILLLVGFIVIFPFIWMICTSFKSGAEVYSIDLLPKHFSLENYITVANKSNFPLWFKNSLLVGGITTLSVLVFDPMVGFAFSKYKFKGKNIIFMIILSTMMIPTEMLVIPWYLMVNAMKWNNTYWALVFPSLSSAFGIFLTRQFFDGVPEELLEAARIDGMNELQIYMKVALPLIGPAISALAIFTFLGSWNSFLWPVIAVDGYTKFTIPVGLAMFSGEVSTSWELILSAASIATIPVLIVFIIFQRKIVEGVALSGIKG